MKLSDYIVNFLAENGITDVFGYPGGMVTHLMDSFSRQSAVASHVNYHEQGAAFCACGYAQTTGRIGVAYATSGPGATNLITGIANAYFDSIPTIFITGQVNTYESKGSLSVRQKGFQETDIVSIVSPITKLAVCVTNQNDIKYYLDKAVYTCKSGRMGPVLLDIPMDILHQEIDPSSLRGFTPPSSDSVNINGAVDTILSALKNSARPCMVVGSAVSACGMREDMRALADILRIPVVVSMPAVDIFPADLPYYYGFIGAYGNRHANFVVAKSDLVVSVGSRLDCRQTGGEREKFAPNSKIIRVDIDQSELENVVRPDETHIVADIRDLIPALLSAAKNAELPNRCAWLSACDDIKHSLESEAPQPPNEFMAAISRHIPDNSVITTDVGQNQVWAAQSFEIKPNQRMLFSSGHGAMGYSLPAAIGAYYGCRSTVYSINGDGGFMMNLQELQFIAREQLPIKIIVMNNHALGMIRHFQEMYFDSNYTGTKSDCGYTVPDLAGIAAAFGLEYHLVSDISQCTEEIFSSTPPQSVFAAPSRTDRGRPVRYNVCCA